MISWQDFEKVKMHVGTILRAEINGGARKPAYKLEIDFGELGIKKSSAQITKVYKTEELIGKQVIAVTNFPEKNVAGFTSGVLVLGVVQGEGEDEQVILLQPERKAENGKRVL